MFMHRRFVKLINKNVRDSLFSENKPFCKISSSVFIESSEIFYGKNGRLNTTFLLLKHDVSQQLELK